MVHITLINGAEMLDYKNETRSADINKLGIQQVQACTR